MFHEVVDGEAEMVVVVHVDDILAHGKDQAAMDRFAAELGQKFKLKDMSDAGYYMGCHITRSHKAHELKFNQHLYVESTVKRIDVKKATKIPAASGCANALKGGRIAEPRGEDGNEEVPVPGGSGGAHVGGDDDTAGHCVRRTRCGQVLRKPWAGA